MPAPNPLSSSPDPRPNTPSASGSGSAPRQVAPVAADSETTPGHFFRRFFSELDARNIPYVVIHSYHKLPDAVTSDVDYAVQTEDIPKVHLVLRDTAASLGWLVVQNLQHEICAFYSVAVNPANFRHSVKLDLCSDYVKEGRRYLSAEMLLNARRQRGGFWIPAPAVEFAYLLAKALGKRKAIPAVMPRLRELWAADPCGAASRLNDILGPRIDSLDAFEQTALNDAEVLRRHLRQQHSPFSRDRWRESLRVWKRLTHPTGLYVAVMTPGGHDLAPLFAQVEEWLEPCFRSTKRFQFPPHPFISESWPKAFGGLARHFAGYWLKLYPKIVRSGCILCERPFDDLFVAPSLHRLLRGRKFLFSLRGFFGQPDLTFIVDAPAEILHQRNPVRSIPEIQRRQKELKKLAQNNPHYVTVSAQAPVDQIAQAVCRRVAELLAARLSRYQRHERLSFPG